MSKEKYRYVDESVPELYKINEYWRDCLFLTPMLFEKEYSMFITLKYQHKYYKLRGCAINDIGPYIALNNKIIQMLKNIGCTEIDVNTKHNFHD